MYSAVEEADVVVVVGLRVLDKKGVTDIVTEIKRLEGITEIRTKTPFRLHDPANSHRCEISGPVWEFRGDPRERQ